MVRVLVTGGYGFIGSRVVRKLVERGYAVRCLVRSPESNTRRLAGLPWKAATGDVRDRDSLAAAMAECDACVHLASISSWEEIRSAAIESTVIGGTTNVVRAAHATGTQRVVFVSSATAVNASSDRPRPFDETSPFQLEGTGLRYAIAKHRAEEEVHAIAAETGLDVVTVNPVETYGPDDTKLVTAGNLRDMLRDWPALGCHGGTAVAHVDDVAEGIVLALENGRAGERYILGGDNLAVEQLIRLTLELGGQASKPVLILPNALVLGVVGLLARLRLPTPLEPDVLDYATRYWFVDDRKARTELGYAPRPAREVLAPTVGWLYEAGYVKR